MTCFRTGELSAFLITGRSKTAVRRLCGHCRSSSSGPTISRGMLGWLLLGHAVVAQLQCRAETRLDARTANGTFGPVIKPDPRRFVRPQLGHFRRPPGRHLGPENVRYLADMRQGGLICPKSAIETLWPFSHWGSIRVVRARLPVDV